MSELGNKIRELRNAKNISIKALSEEIGYSNAYISMVETGQKDNPSYAFLSSVANGLGSNDEEKTKILGELSNLAGFNIEHANSFLDMLNVPSLNMFNSVDKGLHKTVEYAFPVNDLFFHLTDVHNTKFYKTIMLNDNDRKYINKMIESYLLQKYEIIKNMKDKTVNFTEKDFKDIAHNIKNQKLDDYFKTPKK